MAAQHFGYRDVSNGGSLTVLNI